MFEYVNCNLCGKDNTVLLFKAEGFNIVKCKSCGLTYVNPRFKEAERKDVYSEGYFRGTLSNMRGIDHFARWEEIQQGSVERMAKIMRYKAPGKILDVGCAIGSLLETARSYGWECYGIELSSFAADYAREKLNLNVFCGTLEQANYPENFFDVITLYHVIEHLPDPTATLMHCRKLLKPDGILVVEVPDFGSAQAQRLKESYHYVKPQEHIYYFTTDTLKKLLRKSGFKPSKIFLKGGTGLLCPSGIKKVDKAKDFIVRHMKYFKWIRAVMRYIYFNLLRRNDQMTIFAIKIVQSQDTIPNS
jgi:2-polyprenyl-3-methyl-5-hydroxy-6-metoxy-1,4-benzoquinol methylase